ncbi:metal ABC transporter substrate-binding protein [Rothia sp. P5764]|uniref:metal ABC transporter substrate-binding protein n=1 Tax=unclassified Rothia (in: high G+C Gram-positive bacteria) TaxID=2689056 RepID=UPI003AC4FC0F
MTSTIHADKAKSSSRSWGRSLFAMAAALLLICLSACSAKPGEANSEKPYVLATFTVIADIAQNIGGEYVQVESLTKAGAEIHGYDPTPSDVRKASEADLIIANGLHLESWLDKFLQDSKAPAAILTEGIEPISITEDAGAGYPNPHAWMSPVAAQVYVDNIVKALSEVAPEHADDFENNAKAYKGQLEEVHQELVDSLSQLPSNQRMLVTCEGAFSYLAADAGLTEAYLWAVNSDGQTGAQRIAQIVEEVATNNVPAVFCESTVSARSMEQVAAESHAKFGGTLYVDSLSEEGGPVPTYLDLIRYDTQLIADALGSKD